ncbi:MAG: hypothetical protein HW421_3903 [Ignavibacteria bacterium]|nr:hypothetical protein [Ignavibacteria bacterium]
MTEHKKLYSKIISRLAAVRRIETSLLITTGVINTLTAMVVLVLLVACIEAIGQGNESFRQALVASFGIFSLSFAGYFLFSHILRAFGIRHFPTIEQIALRTGLVYPDIKDRLCNSLQLVSNAENRYGTSREMAFAAFDAIYEGAKSKKFNKIIDYGNIKRAFLRLMIALVLSVILFFAFNQTLPAALYRVANYNKSFLPPAPFSLSIEPREASILRGASAEIVVKATGKTPQTVTLYVKEEQQEKFDSYTLKPDSDNVFRYSIPVIKHSLIFYAQSYWLSSAITTETGKILVIDKPLVRSLSGRIIYPAYTGLAPKDFNEQTGDISALTGSTAELRLLSNKDLKNAQIIIEKISSGTTSDTQKIKMNCDGRKAFGTFKVAYSGTYFIRISDKENQENVEPIRYGIIALTDAYPSISLLSPGGDAEVSENAVLPIRAAISDDYGFSSLKLYYRLAESRYTMPDEGFQSKNIPIAAGIQSSEIPYFWNLHELGISPSDRYEFYLEVADNDRITGPKTAKTGILSVRLPSLEEVLEETDKEQLHVEKELEKILKQAEETRKEMNELNRELMKKQNQPNIDWKEKKKAEDVMRKQEELKDKFADLQKNIENMTKNLQESKALSQETVEKFLELQKLMQEVKSPELDKMQQRINQMLEKATPEQLQKAMKEAEFSEEQFKKSIERTIKLLQRIKAEQKVDALSKFAEELAKKQEELEKKLENSNQNSDAAKQDAARQQKALEEDLKYLQKELNELNKLMKDLSEDMPMSELEKAKEELNSSETEQAMENAQNQCKSGNFDKARASQKKASKNLKNFADQMKKLKEAMEKASKKEAIRQLQKSMSDMLKLSEKQESLKQKTQSADNNSMQLSDFAEQQSEILEAMINTANGLMKLGTKSFSVTPEMSHQIGNSLQEMQKAIEQLSDRRSQQAAKSQSGAMSAMNQAISQMQQSLSALQKPGSGSCNNPGGSGQGSPGGDGQAMMQRLQQIASQQQGINSALKQMMQNSGKLDQRQQAEMGKLAGKQGGAMKSVEELAKEQKQMAGDKKPLGSLEQIAKEMKEVMAEIQSGHVNQQTLHKQERILSRLLDATRSMNDRDFEKKRESKTGKDIYQSSPNAIDLNTQEGRNRALEELLKSIQQGYSKDYEQFIRKYFETIQANGGKKN